MTKYIATNTEQAPKLKPVKRGNRQTRFLAQSVILEEAGISGLIRLAMFTIFTVICGFLYWASITNVDEIAVTAGEVFPTGQVQSVQHLEGGIISEIYIEEGQVVESGQNLLKIDPADALTELRQMSARKTGLELQAERLRAIGTGRKPDFSIAGQDYQDLIVDQQAIYEGQNDALENRRLVILNQIEHRNSELNSNKSREKTFKKNFKLTQDEFAIREKLYKQGLATKVSFLEMQRQLNQARGDLANLLNERKEIRESLQEFRNKLAELVTDAKENALAQMGLVTNELAQINETIKKLEDRVSRLEVRAPVRGIVKGLMFHTLGGVIPEGAVILDIVPLDKELIIETQITTRDIGHITVGQNVNVKITAFDYARFGSITGKLKSISATTHLNDDGEPYYKGVVTLDQGYVGNNSKLNRILPGMTVQADIKTGNKTLLSYLLKPVTSSINSSFRER